MKYVEINMFNQTFLFKDSEVKRLISNHDRKIIFKAYCRGKCYVTFHHLKAIIKGF